MIPIDGIEHIILILALFVCAIMDLQKKMIYLPFMMFCSFLIIILQIAAKELSLASVVAALALMLIICGISVVSRGQLGMGDGLLLAMTSLGLGAVENLHMLFYCFVGVFFAALLWLLVFHGKKESKIPLAPFVLAASILVLV